MTRVLTFSMGLAMLFLVAAEVRAAQETIVLTETTPDTTISYGATAKVYGTSGENRVTIEIGANVTLINFPGTNIITIQSDSNLFKVSRSGATVTFEGPDNTFLKMPATTSIQKIYFKDNDITKTLTISNNEVILGDQVVTSESAEITLTIPVYITDYFPQSGPAGSYVLLKLEKSIADLGENIQVLYNQQKLDTDKVSQNSEDILQITIPEDAESGSIQVKSDKYVSNTVLFSVLSSISTPLVSQSVSPSSTKQSVSYNDEISVTIPSGVLDTTRNISISKVENSPTNAIAPFSQSFAYDVTIEGLEQLDDYIEIKVKYNPDLLNSEYPVEDQLMPMRYNDTEKSWIPLPYHVDINSQTLSIYTDHLCVIETIIITGLVIGNAGTWSGVGQELLNDIYITPEGNFRLLYSKSGIDSNNHLEDTTWSRTTYSDPLYPVTSYQTGHPKFIQDMGNLLETVLKQYVSVYNFKDPITKPGWLWGTSKNPITVKMDSWWTVTGGGGDPNYEKIWEIIHFPTLYLYDFSQFTSYATIGHELFHRMEAEYYGIAGFKAPANLWWMEAAAEYAGNRAAWPGKQLDNLHEKTGSDFLSYPISTTGVTGSTNGWQKEQEYQYAASAFIQFLVEKKSLDFKSMMEHVSGGSPLYTPLEMLNGYKSLILAQYYRDFAAWGVFGDDSFLKKYKISEIAERKDSITVNNNASIKLSFTGGNFSTINIYKFDQEYDRTADVPGADRTIGKDDIHEISVNKGDVLYLLATNSGQEDETLYVSVREMLKEEQKQELPHVFQLKGGYSGKLWVIKIAEDSATGWHLLTAKEAVYSPYKPNINNYGKTFKITSSEDSSFISWIYPDEEMVVGDNLIYQFDATSTPGKVETVIKWTDTIYPDSGKRNVDMKLTITREWLPANFPQILKPGQSIDITENISAKIEPDPKTLGDSLSFTPKMFGLMKTSVNGDRLRPNDADPFVYTNINIENTKDSLLNRNIAWLVPDGVSGDQLAISFVASDSGSAGLGYSYGSYMDSFQSAGITLIYEFR